MFQPRYVLFALALTGFVVNNAVIFGEEKSNETSQRFESAQRVANATVVAVTGWSQFRGPDRENKSFETGLLKSWPEGGPSIAWQFSELGEGYSSFSIADGKVITMGNVDGKERVIALNLVDGAKIWETVNGDAYEQGRGNGPRGTPTIDEGRVYSLGGAGELSCVALDSGDVIWHKNILEEFEGDNITWGISESVLIDGEKLICTPGGKKGSVVALNKSNGEVIWTSIVSGEPRAGYCSAIVITVGGVRQYVTFTSNSVVGIRAADGEPMWQNASSANKVANVSTALFHNDHVFSSSNYGTGAALVHLTSEDGKTEAEEVYATKKMKNHHGGMVLLDGHVYGSNNGILTCMEFSTGDVKWEERTNKGSLTYADGMLFFRSEKGPVQLVEVTTDEFRSLGQFEPKETSEFPKWAHPVVADGKLFIRDMTQVDVYDIRQK